MVGDYNRRGYHAAIPVSMRMPHALKQGMTDQRLTSPFVELQQIRRSLRYTLWHHGIG